MSHRSRRHRAAAPRGSRLTALSAAAVTAASLGAGTAAAQPAEDQPAAGAKVDKLYVDAERATEKYNAASERTKKLQRQLSRTQDQAARGQAEVNRLRDSLGTVAGSQYRAAGLDPTLALLLSSNPDAYLEKAATLERTSLRTAGRLAELQRAQRVLRQHRQEGATQLAQLESQRTELSRQQRNVRGKLATAQRMLNRMTPTERAERERASRGGTATRAAAATPASTAASGRAGGALTAAQGVLGRPYAWGQAGPSAFDCAGLTQWAYRQAGISLPRTSQAQAQVGRRVSLDQAQPGDLVIYRGDASHVALYAGNGQVIHSPYPGAQVRYDPVGMMPVSTVTRP